MASRRARIKVAPNLSSVRSKGRTEDKCKDHVPKQTVDNNKNHADKKLTNGVAVEETVPKNLVMNGIHSNRTSVENNNAKKIVETKIVPEKSEKPKETEKLTESAVETKPSEIIKSIETKSPETPKTVETKTSEPVTVSETKSSWQEPNPGGATGKFVDGRYIPTEAEPKPEAPAAPETKPAEAKSATIRRFLGRPKFKPNLAPRARPDELPRRTRKFSSGDKTEQRKRNNSTGNTSEGEGNNETAPARIRRISSSENVDTLGRTRKLSTGDKVETTGRRRLRSESNSSDDEGRRMVRVNGQPMLLQPRTRRLTDTMYMCDQKINPGLKRRKVESKRRFSNGVPGRGKMTMFDLIYYNPENGTEMLVDEDDLPEKIAKVGEAVEQAVDAPATPPTPPEEDEEEDAVPVPQVKVGINGEIILDESSTMLETTAAKKAKTDLSNSPIVVENASKFTNYGTWSKKKRYSDWSEQETFKFYEALSIVGSDFSMMASLFKKRTRKELKLKFKKEERINNALVDKCLKQKGSFTDIDRFMEEESEDDVIEEKEKELKETRGRKRKSKGPTSRRRISTRGLYASSSGGEEADVSETSRSPARKRATGRKVADQKRKTPVAGHPRKEPPPSNTPAGIRQLEAAKRAPPPTESVPPTESSLQKLPGVRFPPALLAANPGLAGAKPGSLVVVASPSKTDPSAQLLHVYMVSEKKKKLASQSINHSSNSSVRAGSVEMPRTEPSRRNNDPGRLSIDPAVVRAVDRKRTSVERNQRLQERSPELNTSTDNNTYRRQRTLSEGNLVSPTRLRTLSGSQRTANWLEVESEEGHYLRTRVSTNLGSPSGATSDPESSSQPLGTSSEPSATSTEEASPVETLNLPTLPIARKSKPVLQ